MVKYSRGYTPLCLVDDKIQEAFDKDVDKKKYVDNSSRYKCKHQKDGIKIYPVSDALKDIYKNKCAYCETHFNRTFIKIEHYRPKSIYYALAYSWSNLLPICDICNTTKSNNFEVDSMVVKDTIRTLQKLQYSTKMFNRIEKPKFLHPEIDDYENMFRFDSKGYIVVFDKVSNSHRMVYTIKYANLNEKALAERRAKLFKDFTNMTDELFLLAKNNIEYDKSMNSKIVDFFNDENEFIAVRKFIIKYLHIFLKKFDDVFIENFRDAIQEYISTVEVYNKTINPF